MTLTKALVKLGAVISIPLSALTLWMEKQEKGHTRD